MENGLKKFFMILVILKKNELADFDKWYDTVENNNFDFKKEMSDYCDDDVTLLRKSVLKFRKMVIDFLKIDFLGKPYITISQLSMAIFKMKFLKSNRLISKIDGRGFFQKERHSKLADSYLKYLEYSRKITIQKAGNNGEKKINRYLIDGFYIDNENNEICIEICGCFYHPHENCTLFNFSRDVFHPSIGKTMGEIIYYDYEKHTYLKNNNYILQIYRECEINKDLEFIEFKKNNHIVSPLVPEDAFYGGRVSTFKLRANVEESVNQSIKYFDYNAMYSGILKFEEYPIGFPEILENFDSLDISNYWGLIKCDILVDQNIYIPPIPYRYKKRLFFPKCYTCLKVRTNDTCDHSEKDRFLRGTWFIKELEQAIQLKQISILRIFEVWDWKNRSNTIFEEFINFFGGKKIEYSGFPANVTSELEKQNFIEKWKNWGFSLDYSILNKGENIPLKNLFKLMPNSLYGRFGMNTVFTYHRFCYTEQDFFSLLKNDIYNILKIQIFPNDTVALVQYKLKDARFDLNISDVNIVYAISTAAYGRAKLTRQLSLLNTQCLYCDTDSIIFLTGECKPKLDCFIGDFKDELPNNEIVSFASLGPKQYILSYKVSGSNKIDSKIVAGGFTLNVKALQVVNYNSINKIIDKYIYDNEKYSIQVFSNNRFFKDRVNFDMYTLNMHRTYRLSLNKRCIIKKEIKNKFGTRIIDTMAIGSI